VPQRKFFIKRIKEKLNKRMLLRMREDKESPLKKCEKLK